MSNIREKTMKEQAEALLHNPKLLLVPSEIKQFFRTLALRVDELTAEMREVKNGDR